MKLSRERTEFEGTVAEFLEARIGGLFNSQTADQHTRPNVTLLEPSAEPTTTDGDTFVPAPAWATTEERVRERMAADNEFVRRVMERLPLRERHQQLFAALLEIPAVTADTKENTAYYLTRDQICARLDISIGGLNGLLGPLGSRVNATERDDMDTTLGIGVLFYFMKVDGMWAYALRPTFRRWLTEYFIRK